MKLSACVLVPVACLSTVSALAQSAPAPAPKPAPKPAAEAKPAPNTATPAPKPAVEARPAANTAAPASKPVVEAKPAAAAAAGSAGGTATTSTSPAAAATAAAPAAEPAPPEAVAPAEPVAAQPAPAAPVAVAPAPATAPPAPEPAVPAAEPSSLELFGMVAPTAVHGEPANPQLTNSFRRVGIYGEGGVAYRSKYFLDPFISVGYGTLASGTTEIPDAYYNGADHPGGTLHQHLGIWVISPGVTADIWRFRLRLGVGLAVVVESNRFQGEKNTATQLPLVAQVGVAYNFYQVPRFRLDAEARFVRAAGADVTFWTLGVTARGDVVTF